jgi:hypothetical protein
VPIVKPAQIQHKYNTKAARIHKTNTKQTKRKQYCRKRNIKVLEQNPYTVMMMMMMTMMMMMIIIIIIKDIFDRQ